MDTFGGQQRQLDRQVVGDVPQRQHRSHQLQAHQRPNRLRHSRHRSTTEPADRNGFESVAQASIPVGVVDGVAVGMCSIEADAFPTRRSAETGSWVGRRYQRRGIGREVRHAAQASPHKMCTGR